MSNYRIYSLYVFSINLKDIIIIMIIIIVVVVDDDNDDAFDYVVVLH